MFTCHRCGHVGVGSGFDNNYTCTKCYLQRVTCDAVRIAMICGAAFALWILVMVALLQ